MKTYSFPLQKSGAPWKTVTVTLENQEEIAVLEYLNLMSGKNQKPDIIKSLSMFGGHENFESKKQRTSMRKLQQILHDLTFAGVPVISHPKEGIWITGEVEEIVEYATWLERKAKEDIKTMMARHKKLIQIAGIEQTSIFDTIQL